MYLIDDTGNPCLYWLMKIKVKFQLEGVSSLYFLMKECLNASAIPNLFMGSKCSMLERKSLASEVSSS